MSLDAQLPGFFTNMVDELILDLAPFDPELDEGLKYIDSEASKRGITFYEMVFQVTHNHIIEEKAREWNENRN